MAKNRSIIWCFLIASYFSGGCLFKNSSQDLVPDTPPGTEINKTDVWVVNPIPEVRPGVDTVSIVTELVHSSNPKKKDTVKKIITVSTNTRPLDYRSAVQKVYVSYIGTREKSGRNDGPEVEIFLKSVGLGRGNPWCAAFVHFCLERGGVKNVITAWSPTSLNKNNLVWFNKKALKTVLAGDVFSLYYPNLGRIGHTGFVNRDMGGTYESVEGNTNNSLSREGDGVYKKIRSKNGTFAMSRWIN